MSAARQPVSASLDVDVTEVRSLARRYGTQADRWLMDELSTAMEESITLARREANRAITGGEGSRLAKASRQEVRVRGRSLTGIADWDAARSDAGFPYAAAVDRGRKAFGPKHAKALRFEIGGRVIFTRWVRASTARNFTGRGLERARPHIHGRFHAAIARWTDRMARAA